LKRNSTGSEYKRTVLAILFVISLGPCIPPSFTGAIFMSYFSNANDVTQQYGPHLTEHLLKAVKPEKCILDGELLLWDSVANKFEEFGSLRYFHRNNVQDGQSRQDIGDRFGKYPCCA
jgi:hypothetical protein